MRRTLLISVASTIVLAATPGAALARHHHRHHRARHHARIERFGTDSSTSGTSASSSADNAGTVASFSNGILTVTLSDGSTVSGRVTSDTEIECQTAGSQEMARDDGGPGDETGGGDDQSTSGENQAENENENENEAQSCDSSALTPGATVREAELRISSDGAAWKKVELQQ